MMLSMIPSRTTAGRGEEDAKKRTQRGRTRAPLYPPRPGMHGTPSKASAKAHLAVLPALKRAMERAPLALSPSPGLRTESGCLSAAVCMFARGKPLRGRPWRARSQLFAAGSGGTPPRSRWGDGGRVQSALGSKHGRGLAEALGTYGINH